MQTTGKTLSLPAPFSAELRGFTIIWLGQLVSLFGSALTSFSLGLWVFQKNHSVTQYALIALAITIPRVLVSPFAGALVDRWDRRWTILLSDLGAGFCSLALAVLLFTQRLDVGMVYLIVGLASIFSAFQIPAYAASITLLVPKAALGRVNGMVQLGQSLAEVFAPLAAGFLLLVIQIQGVILIDFITFLVAVITLAFVHIPRPPVSARPQVQVQTTWLRMLLREVAAGWHVISGNIGLVGLLFFMALFSFQWSMVSVLAAPLVLSFSGSDGLGIFMTVAGCGMLGGSLAMSAWGGPRRRIAGMLLFEFISGLCFILIGVHPSLILVALAAFGAHLTIAVIAGSNRALWQTKIAPEMQGRVFALQEMVTRSVAPLAILAAGPLAERIFEPLMSTQGGLSGSLGLVLGVGPGRGIALMFVCLGILQAAVAISGALFRPLRAVETDLPDVV